MRLYDAQEGQSRDYNVSGSPADGRPGAYRAEADLRPLIFRNRSSRNASTSQRVTMSDGGSGFFIICLVLVAAAAVVTYWATGKIAFAVLAGLVMWPISIGLVLGFFWVIHKLFGWFD